MARASWHEDERARPDLNLLNAEREREGAVENIERLLGALVDMGGNTERPSRVVIVRVDCFVQVPNDLMRRHWLSRLVRAVCTGLPVRAA